MGLIGRSFGDSRGIVLLKHSVVAQGSVALYQQRTCSTRTSNQEYCLSLIRKHDYEGYLSTVALEEEARSIAIPVRAFNVEIAQVAAAVTDLKIGLIRLQFWKDVVEEIYNNGKCRQQPVAEELCKVILRHKLPKALVMSLIEKREENIGDKGFRTLTEMDDYSKGTVSAQLKLIAHVYMTGAHESVVRAVSDHCGTSCGAALILRSLPYHRGHGRCPLPWDLLTDHNMSQHAAVTADRHLLFPVVRHLADHAATNASKTRSKCRVLPRQVRRVFLPLIATESYLKRLKRLNYDVFDASLNQRNNLLALNLWWRRKFGL